MFQSVHLQLEVKTIEYDRTTWAKQVINNDWWSQRETTCCIAIEECLDTTACQRIILKNGWAIRLDTFFGPYLWQYLQQPYVFMCYVNIHRNNCIWDHNSQCNLTQHSTSHTHTKTHTHKHTQIQHTNTQTHKHTTHNTWLTIMM